MHIDNNHLFYEKKSLSERFPEREITFRGKKAGDITIIKTIIRGNIINLKITGPHTLSVKIQGCNGIGIKN
jgi:hypothetical protein